MSSPRNGTGLGFFSILALIFITLKLTDNIDWSWWWVLSPLWISAIFTVVITVVLYMLTAERR